MKVRRLLVVLVVIAMVTPFAEAQSRAGRGAKRGAAMGAVWGLIFGGVDGAVEGAAAGAAVGAVGGAVSGSYARKDARRMQKQQQEAEARAQAEAERQQLEEERRQLEAERQALEEQQAQAAATSSSDELTEEQWISYIGVDNWNALIALTDCQHERALLLAQAGATIDDSEYRLASMWIEVLVHLDRKDQAALDALYPTLVELDSEVDTTQQASLEADKAILEIRDVRREEGITCAR